MRADREWDERLGAAGEGAGVDVGRGQGHTSEISDDAAVMLHADLFDPAESMEVMGRLVHNYTSMTQGPLFEILRSMGAHALALGVLTERQRWETTSGVDGG